MVSKEMRARMVALAIKHQGKYHSQPGNRKLHGSESFDRLIDMINDGAIYPNELAEYFD